MLRIYDDTYRNVAIQLHLLGVQVDINFSSAGQTIKVSLRGCRWNFHVNVETRQKAMCYFWNDTTSKKIRIPMLDGYYTNVEECYRCYDSNMWDSSELLSEMPEIYDEIVRIQCHFDELIIIHLSQYLTNEVSTLIFDYL